jgi:hypothetical protein
VTISGGTDFHAFFAKHLAVREHIDSEEGLREFVKAAEAGKIPLPLVKSALRGINAALRAAGEPEKKTTTHTTKGGPKVPTTTKFKNKSEVLQEANRLSKELMKQDPTLTLAQARDQVWQQNPDLARQYKELPEVPAPKKAQAVRKGDSIIRKVNEKAQELRKADPTLTPASARTQVWETHPDLVEAYRREIS